MTIPVMPGNENAEYIVTQAIADYLSMDKTFNLDGIVFPSIQTKIGSNIVLFHKASRVEKRNVPPGTKITVKLWEHDEDGAYPSYNIDEEIPRGEISESPSRIDEDLRLPSLTLDDQSIKIHLVREVRYTSESDDLHIMRHEEMDFHDIFKSR